MKYKVDPKLDLVLERTTDVPPEKIWRVWTDPELMKKWFCPKPWQTTEAEIEMFPGGMFRTVMRGPNGEEGRGTGCILVVKEGQELVWTSALLPGYRPAPATEDGDFPFTAVVQMERQGNVTKYTAIAIHRDEAGRTAHEKMGFHEGWGAAYEQMIELCKSL